MIYLRRPTPITHGHVACMDSPWAITSIGQAQFRRGDFAATYGDGSVQDILSLDLCDWDDPGIVYGVNARKSPRQIVDEVPAQVRANLDDGATLVPDAQIHSWFLDPGITDAGLPSAANDELLLVNTTGSWDDRPWATTRVPNLFPAGDYVRNTINPATMEGADESGRAAADAVSRAAGSSATPATEFALYQEPALAPWRRADDVRYRLGLPNAFDLIRPYRP
ncbi:FAD-dependent oxidoreductase [Embleya sp. NPDC020630]|uniref:FAD-dependent oxidoreductase n=1 Tax=Embleya sp. NPDC020630 TaxID=3363979 RepID=UPI0037975EA1